MITNIIATVFITLVTNVTHSDNAQWGVDYGIMYLTNPEKYGRKLEKPATERYVTTEIIQRKTLTAQHDGTQFSSVQDKMLSSVTEILRLREQWEPSGIKTNSPYPWGVVYTNVIWCSTNVVTTNILWLNK